MKLLMNGYYMLRGVLILRILWNLTELEFEIPFNGINADKPKKMYLSMVIMSISPT